MQKCNLLVVLWRSETFIKGRIWIEGMREQGFEGCIGTDTEDVRGDPRKPHIEENHNLYDSLYIITMTELRITK
jgi:hypothetical protein